jgi:hypothetical protein
MFVIRICGLPNLENPDSLFREIAGIASVLVKSEDKKPVIYFLDSQLGWHLNRVVHVEIIGRRQGCPLEYKVGKVAAYFQLESGIRKALEQQFGDIEVYFTHSDGHLQEIS